MLGEQAYHGVSNAKPRFIRCKAKCECRLHRLTLGYLDNGTAFPTSLLGRGHGTARVSIGGLAAYSTLLTLQVVETPVHKVRSNTRQYHHCILHVDVHDHGDLSASHHLGLAHPYCNVSVLCPDLASYKGSKDYQQGQLAGHPFGKYTAYSMSRSTLTSLMAMSHWVELSLVYMARRHPRLQRISGLLPRERRVLATKAQLSIELSNHS